MNKEELYQREVRRKELRELPEIKQWLKRMIQNVNETEVRMSMNEFNRLNRLKQKPKEELPPLFSFTFGAHDDELKKKGKKSFKRSRRTDH